MKIVTPLSGKNNIPTLSEISLDAEFEVEFEGTGEQCFKITMSRYPPHLNGMQFVLQYVDEGRTTYFNECFFDNGSFVVRPVNTLSEIYNIN